MMRNGEWSERKDILCVNPPKWKEEKKKSEDDDAHTYHKRRKKEPSKNQVIKLFMKLYEKKMKEKKAKKAKPSDR